MRFTSASAALGRKIRGCLSTSSISKRQTDHLRHPWQSPHLYGDSFSPAILYGMEYRIAGLIWDMEKKPTDSQRRGRVLPAQRRPCRIKFFSAFVLESHEEGGSFFKPREARLRGFRFFINKTFFEFLDRRRNRTPVFLIRLKRSPA